MNIDELVAGVKALGLPEGSFVVFGSAPLLLHGIRETGDIDMFVTPSVYEQLKNADWEVKSAPSGGETLVRGIYDIGKDWTHDGYDPSLEELLAGAEFFEGVPFVDLSEVLKWKRILGREKDLRDITLIEEYLGKKEKKNG